MRIEATIKTFKFLGGWEGVRHMVRKSTLLGIVAALALSRSSHAEEAAAPAASPNKSVLTSTISCNGYPNVPMTKDQEQALPMQIIGSLECGEQVTVLSDMDAYTVNVLTQDGKNGYVARMYLTFPTRRRIDTAPLPSENAAVSNGITRWQSGGKGSAQFRSGSELVESLTPTASPCRFLCKTPAGRCAPTSRWSTPPSKPFTFCRSWFRLMNSRR